MQRLRISLYGAVQGVGFRPFVYRLAAELGLHGTVRNSSSGLTIEVEGGRTTEFLERLEAERPAASVVLAREISVLPPAGYSLFEILESDAVEERTASVLPDLATCPDCLRELLDPADRRHAYPFTNCTQCGPRYSIILDIPYDRPRTTMRSFEMCAGCSREYHDPADRRFHAQPNACPVCGPRLSFAIPDAARALAGGLIVALKGIGGFQLLVDARNETAVARLRRRKRREEKPFALMMPSLDMVREFCRVSDDEARVLGSSAAPIVLLRPRSLEGLAPNLAHNSPYLGVMPPYSPLHHLLMRAFPHPIVATSGNLSDEPIAITNEEAAERLNGIADVFLMHDRPIARPVDDSVARVVRGRESVMRRARGYAPLPVRIDRDLPPVLAVGAHLKNTVAIALGRHVYLSQHVGDLDTFEARAAFERAIDDLTRLYRFKPELIACDLHPDYASTRWALSRGLPVVPVQHHEAHAAACAAENDVRGAYLGVGWDGAGYGRDGTIWGGEFFLVENGRYDRIAHLRPFRLPGGEAAIKEGWRCAAAIRFELGLPTTVGPDFQPAAGLWPGTPRVSAAAAQKGRPHPHFQRSGASSLVIHRMLERGINSPLTSSVGRLFDAVSSIAGIAHLSRFEGQAAMLLERAIGGLTTEEAYPLPNGDWADLISAVENDVRNKVPQAGIAVRFHNALAEWILAVARSTAVPSVCLSGGVFQNGYLVERAVCLLERHGIAAYTHQRVPANDGGIALGQAVIAGTAAPKLA